MENREGETQQNKRKEKKRNWRDIGIGIRMDE